MLLKDLELISKGQNTVPSRRVRGISEHRTLVWLISGRAKDKS